ncbi:glucokinase [Microbacteriaceae bacterium SG_E_30_P1]|uniref:Glucokinase n=1 Tax=Antiquaquibacter oligotrophicus TaxID=2880260 RepID=A0ABT6KLI9_9MICO|nr:ROK family protein [Antiquaquibacter oligotrophicus]MDH6180611.1 glucokinase [Antiquaquibacter oligotrophicus]UDF13656.1 ROK family protein [Antiquaquibacter oligotrophicus]
MAQWALAVDLGGTKIEAALVDAAGAVLPGSRFRLPTGGGSSSAELEAGARAVIGAAYAALPPGESLLGVGIGSAGPIDVHRGLVSPLNLPAWRDFPLRALAEEVVPATPVVLRIDGEAIALAEQWVGAARGSDNLLGMVVSTGIGGGLILGGRALAGPTGNAGHIGHVEVGGMNVPCLCGGTGCVEAVASGPATTAWARAQGWAGSTGEDLAASYAAGDAIARAAVQRSGTAVGQAIASATALLDLELVAIGGGFSRVSPDLFGFIREAIARRSPFPFVAKVRVVPSGLSDEGPLIGAAALIHRADYRSEV